MFNTKTHYCLDGTPNCPVTGTLGSWSLYVLGIFMACVFQLGPKSNFGRTSEQNAAFWLKLFLPVRQYSTSPTYSYHDSVENTTKSFQLNGSQWVRFLVSYLVNGIGYHILVHALPIQIAAQSSLTGVVFRAVGMIYLTSLDDISGNEITMIPPDDDTEAKDDDTVGSTASLYSFFGGIGGTTGGGGGGGRPNRDELEVVKAAEKIIVKAQAKLDELRHGRGGQRRRRRRATTSTSPSPSTGASKTLLAEF